MQAVFFHVNLCIIQAKKLLQFTCKKCIIIDVRNKYTTQRYKVKENKNMKVLVKIYDGVKYFRGSEKVTEHTYTDVESWKVVGGREAEEVEKEFIGNDLDEFQEYLILSFADGTTATFRNSHTDLFKIY